MFKRVVLAAGIMCTAVFGLGGVSEAQAAGPHGHGGHGHHGHGGHGHSGHGHWSHGHGYGHWHGHMNYRPYYPQPYYVPYVAPAPVYAYPQPYYYNRGPSLFLGSGGMTVRVPF